MTSLISILSQFETRCKMVLILTIGLILLVHASAGKLQADDRSKAQMHYMTGLKLLKDQSQNAATNNAKANIWLPWPLMRSMKGRCFTLGYLMKKAAVCKRI